MTRPRLLDLFCGAGGAAMGYHRAGFDVVGVDIAPQPRYPFEFVQADAIEFMAEEALMPGFDVYHASPPCQAYSWSARRWDVPRADLLDPTRQLLKEIGRPWVIENVIGAPMDGVALCGTYFGLGVLRHRRFESSELLLAPGGSCRHIGTVGEGDYVTVAGHGGDNAKGHGSRAQKQAAMGIDWMTDVELNEAIPPAYTEWIGRQLLASIEAVA